MLNHSCILDNETMKKTVKRIIVKLITPIVTRLGIPVAINPLKTLISIVQDVGYRPKLIIDVGANHGGWTRSWKTVFPDAKYILIEPQEWLQPSFQDLLDSKTIYLPIGAGKEDSTSVFTVNAERDDSSTFSLSPEDAKSLGYKQMEISVKTLNTVVREYGDVVPDIVKIDAEGLDIDVLDGSTELFGKTEMFLVEASINSSWKQTNVIRVINYMDTKGYRVFDLTDINRPFSNKVLCLVEIVFVRKGGHLDSVYG